MTRRPRRFVLGTTSAALWSCLAWGQAPTASTQPVAGTGGPRAGAARRPAQTDNRPLAELIKDLGDVEWRVRDAATEALIERGPASYDTLKEAFDKTDRYEVRRRIKQAVREIYIRSKAGPPPAFLGIQLAVIPFPPGDGAYSNAVKASDVIRSTAAERGGIKKGDLIMAVDGRRFSRSFPGEQFQVWVKAQSPGTVCKLGILRGANGMQLKHDPRHKVEDLALVSELALRRVLPEEDKRLESGTAGLEVTAPNPAADALQLLPGDLIVSVNDEPAPKEGALLPSGEVQSLRVIRGGQWIDLEISLGKRPRTSIQPGNAEEGREQASAAFVYWWREHFDPEGRVEEGAVENADPAWRLDP